MHCSDTFKQKGAEFSEGRLLGFSLEKPEKFLLTAKLTLDIVQCYHLSNCGIYVDDSS